MVAGGWRADEREVERITVEMLKILQYLGGLRPPVIHRWVGAAPGAAWAACAAWAAWHQMLMKVF